MVDAAEHMDGGGEERGSVLSDDATDLRTGMVERNNRSCGPPSSSADAVGECSVQESSDSYQPAPADGHQHMTVHGPEVHVPSHDEVSSADQQIMPFASQSNSGLQIALLFAIVAASVVAWFSRKQRKEQEEWQRTSANQLEVIRQRNLQSSTNEYFHLDSVLETPCVSSAEDEMQNEGEGEPSDENAVPNASSANKETRLMNSDEIKEGTGADCYMHGNANDDYDTEQSAPDRLSQIRARQQEQLEWNAKSTLIQMRKEKKKKKRSLQESLDHKAADEAYERRMKTIAEGVALQGVSPEEERPRLDEAEEMERMALLHQQNVEYEESLMRDRERATQAALEDELRSKREAAMGRARRRLIAAGVEGGSESAQVRSANDERGIRLRLMLPSGQKVERRFASHHAMGLVYDLAQLMLNESNLLCNEDGSFRRSHQQDQEEKEEENTEEGSHDEIADCTDPDYYTCRGEWKEIFYSFSLSSTYPQRTFDDLTLTLEECGLGGGAMLMVVVESD